MSKYLFDNFDVGLLRFIIWGTYSLEDVRMFMEQLERIIEERSLPTLSSLTCSDRITNMRLHLSTTS